MAVNPFIISGQRGTNETIQAGIQYEIENHGTLKDLSDDVRELKKIMKLLQEPDEKILKQYPTLRDLHDQYRETYILIFGKDLNE